MLWKFSVERDTFYEGELIAQVFESSAEWGTVFSYRCVASGCLFSVC